MLRHKYKVASCRLSVVPGTSLALLGMPDIELLVILEIMCLVFKSQQADRKFKLQTMKPTNILNCKRHTGQIARASTVLI